MLCGMAPRWRHRKRPALGSGSQDVGDTYRRAPICSTDVITWAVGVRANSRVLTRKQGNQRFVFA
jgi:hypothetical protein